MTIDRVLRSHQFACKGADTNHELPGVQVIVYPLDVTSPGNYPALAVTTDVLCPRFMAADSLRLANPEKGSMSRQGAEMVGCYTDNGKDYERITQKPRFEFQGPCPYALLRQAPLREE